jgi:bifunctional non-homologous end joining protein LigD
MAINPAAFLIPLPSLNFLIILPYLVNNAHIQPRSSLMKTIDTISLFFKEGSSDKFYTCSIEEDADMTHLVSFVYGRRGTSGQSGIKCSELSYDEARKVYDKLIKEKMSKGYREDPNAVTHAGIVVDKIDSGVRPQLLKMIDEAEVEKYINDPAWLAQMKFDGKRKLIKRDCTSIVSINRKGEIVGFPSEIEEGIVSQKEKQFIIDGEEVGHIFYAYDIISVGVNDPDVSTLGYLNRYNILNNVITQGPNIKIAPIAQGSKDKRDLYNNLMNFNREGIVFKKADAPYSPGRNDTQVKFKFYSTASCIVTGINKKRSVALGLYKDEEIVPVGNCTIPVNHDIPEKDDIVEIRYLYAYEGGALYQPIFISKRDDLDTDDCKIDQLKYKSTDEIEE